MGTRREELRNQDVERIVKGKNETFLTRKGRSFGLSRMRPSGKNEFRAHLVSTLERNNDNPGREEAR